MSSFEAYIAVIMLQSKVERRICKIEDQEVMYKRFQKYIFLPNPDDFYTNKIERLSVRLRTL